MELRVDHTAPLHDGFCRCRTCKPSLVGNRSEGLLRVRVGLAGLAGAVAAVFAAGGAR
jgi:hypothetical protein